MNHQGQTNISFLKIIALILFLIYGIRAGAQLNVNNLTQYTEKDGLPGSEVNRVLVDKLGYVWVGTINGIARYDGYEFKRFYNDPNDPASIKGSIVWSMYEDHHGQLWIGCGPAYLNKYDPVTKTFSQYEFDKLVNHSPNLEIGISAICENRKHRIYFGVSTYYGNKISSALLYKDEESQVLRPFKTPDSLDIQNVIGMAMDKPGNIWCLNYNGLMRIDTAGRLSTLHHLDSEINKRHDFPTDMKFDKEGHLWLITQRGRLYDFDVAAGTYQTYISSLSLGNSSFSNNSALLIDKDDNIWMGTISGIQFFDRQRKSFAWFKDSSVLAMDQVLVTNFEFDEYGTMWMATNGSGLMKYEDRPRFKSYVYRKNVKESIAEGWALNIMETSDGTLWMTSGGATNSGLSELDLRTGKIRAIPYTSIGSNFHYVYSMWEGPAGNLYLGVIKGVYAYSTKTQKLSKVELTGVPDTITIFRRYKDSRENEWLLALDGLYKREKSSSRFKKYEIRSNYFHNPTGGDITNVFESKKHGLWLLTNDGLFLYDYNTDQIKRHGFDKTKGDVLISQDINSFYEDANGIAWVGTWQGGLSRYNVESGKIRTYTRNDGLPSMSIQGILPDEKNQSLWLSTFEGLSRFDLKTEHFINFSIADGIQSQLFADGSALKTSGGYFVFGGSNGITVFRPEDMIIHAAPPKVFLTDLKLNNQSVIPGKESILKNSINETDLVSLSHNQNNLTLDFLATHFANPLKNRYSYKLENYDNEWRDVGNQHTAFYPNLPPGEYTFRVKAANDKGVWNEQGATLKIIVNHPWWKTYWAYTAYMLFLAAIGFGLNRYYHRRLLQKEKEKNRLRELAQAREIEKAYYELEEAHEALKSTQNQLIQSEKMASLGELTAGIAHEIQNPLNFVNNFSEVNSELLEELRQEQDAGRGHSTSKILEAIKLNTDKINHHGRRADAIVKAMLQHSRIGAGQKESTDINSIAEEFLRLSYHGLSAKNKSFHAEIITSFDESIERLDIIPQEIGRLFLNLYNNAFYAVFERKQMQSNGYTPQISVSTKKIQGRIQIIVRDNGYGIPEKNLDKIFQPFFTTKPTGQGTGLGLSLSYDIVKAHGGSIKVETREHEGTDFIVELPSD